jgi:hypothetical protein
MRNAISIDHDRRHRQRVPLANFHGVERLNKRRLAAFGVCFHHLDNQFPSSHDLAIGIDETQPRRSAMATPMRIMPHIRCAAKPGQTAQRDRRRVCVGIYLKG